MKSIIQSALLAMVLATVAGARAADDLLIADFEGPDYGAWKATGDGREHHCKESGLDDRFHGTGIS